MLVAESMILQGGRDDLGAVTLVVDMAKTSKTVQLRVVERWVLLDFALRISAESTTVTLWFFLPYRQILDAGIGGYPVVANTGRHCRDAGAAQTVRGLDASARSATTRYRKNVGVSRRLREQ